MTPREQFLAELEEIIQNKEKIQKWMEIPNDAFDGFTPNQIIERGEIQRLWVMLYDLRECGPNT